MGNVLHRGDQVKGNEGEYEIVQQVSDRPLATAYKAVTRSSENVFLKQYKEPSVLFTNWFPLYFHYQGAIIERLRHAQVAQFVVAVKEHFVFNNEYFQVHEWVEGKDLADLMQGNLRLKDKLIFARRFVFALARVHQQGIIHSDLKPDNLRLQQKGSTWVLKITDFDWAIDSRNSGFPWDRGPRGTPFYWSLEHLRWRSGNRLGTWSDVQTAGIILYELLSGEHPVKWSLGPGEYDEETLRKKSEKILSSRRSFPHPCNLNPNLPRNIGDAIWEALSPEPNKRPSAERLHCLLMSAGVRLVLVGARGLRYGFDPPNQRSGWVQLGPNVLKHFPGGTNFSTPQAQLKPNPFGKGWVIAPNSSPPPVPPSINGSQLSAPRVLEAGDLLVLRTNGKNAVALVLRVEYEEDC